MATRTGTALVCAWLLAAGCADHAAEAAEPDAVSSERADADGGEVGAGEAAVARDGGVTIHRPPPPPISGGHMLVHEDLVWVADSARDRLGESWIAFASRAASLTLVDADGIERRRVWLDAARGSDVGHALFHDVPSSGVACASCHPEGRDDGLTWDFGEGPRRTHSLVGGISSTAPFHWRGEIRSLAQVMTDTFERQMGGHRVSDAEVDALGAWLDALPAIATASDAAAATRGAEVFDQAGCAVCHAGPLGTRREAAVVDAEMLQVPLLTGVGQRAPYLHDGCAPTLHAVLVGCAGRAPHPGVEALHEAEREDLIAFLARWR
ncbi:MAG: c-type cytochrome [Myxococcales bacterium]|nr:c-type cytochrome [Myxococcales bacterium]